MSLFRQASMWSLRALLVWGAIECGGWLYETGADQAMAVVRLSGHGAAMTRLEERARAAEAQANAEEATLAGLSGEGWRLPVQQGENVGAAAARQLREELMALGAQAPVVDVAAASPAGDITRLRLVARWREPVETAPQALAGMAGRVPHLRVARLVLARGDVVSVEAEFEVTAEAALQQEAAR